MVSRYRHLDPPLLSPTFTDPSSSPSCGVSPTWNASLKGLNAALPK